MNSKTKKALSILSYVLIGIIFLLGLTVLTMSLSTKDARQIPKIFGASALVVSSDSMKKTADGVAAAKEEQAAGDTTKRVYFKKGDLIFIRRLNPEQKRDLVIGDVVTYYDSIIRDFNTHRIVLVQHVGDKVHYTTRGVGTFKDSDGTVKQIPQDENGNDAVIDSGMVEGVYRGKMAGAGAVIEFFQGRLGFGLLIVLPLFAFLAYRIYVVVKLMIAINKEKQGGATLSEMEKMQAEIAKLKAELDTGKPPAENPSE